MSDAHKQFLARFANAYTSVTFPAHTSRHRNVLLHRDVWKIAFLNNDFSSLLFLLLGIEERKIDDVKLLCGICILFCTVLTQLSLYVCVSNLSNMDS